MAFPDQDCPGSLSVAEGDPRPLEGAAWVGRCPHCRAEFALGYAGLLPVHRPLGSQAGELAQGGEA